MDNFVLHAYNGRTMPAGRPSLTPGEVMSGTSFRVTGALRRAVTDLQKRYPGAGFSWVARQLMWLGIGEARSGRHLTEAHEDRAPAPLRIIDLQEARAAGERIAEEFRARIANLDDIRETSKGRLEPRRTKPAQGATLPLVGEIAAGRSGLTLFQTAEPEEIEVPAYYAEVGADYVLRVRGDSMKEVGLFDGSVIYCQRVANSTRARNGEVIVAILNGESYVKRFATGPNGPELHSENPDYPPIPIKPDDQFYVQGIVLGMSHRFGTPRARHGKKK